MQDSPLMDCKALRDFSLVMQEQREWERAEVAALRAVTLEEYEAFDDTQKRRFDARRRKATMFKFLARLPHVDTIAESVNEALEMAADGGRSSAGCILVAGQGGVGKTTVLELIAADVFSRVQFERYGEGWGGLDPTYLRVESQNKYGDVVNAQSVPVNPISATGSMGPKQTFRLFLSSIGSIGVRVDTNSEHLTEAKRKELDGDDGLSLSNQLVRIVKACDTVLVVIDEVHFIEERGPGVQVINYFKTLLNRTNVVFLMAAVCDENGHVRLFDSHKWLEVRDQLRRRTIRHDILPLQNPAANDDLIDLLDVLAYKLVLLKQEPEELVTEKMARYVYRRTKGVAEHVVRLLVTGARKAIGQGEAITIELLNTVRISIDADSDSDS